MGRLLMQTVPAPPSRAVSNRSAAGQRVVATGLAGGEQVRARMQSLRRLFPVSDIPWQEVILRLGEERL